jgi:hypothetical protein
MFCHVPVNAATTATVYVSESGRPSLKIEVGVGADAVTFMFPDDAALRAFVEEVGRAAAEIPQEQP